MTAQMVEMAQRKPRFALFSNGANFACEALQSLQLKGFHPALLVLPEYSPAVTPAVTPASVTLVQNPCKPARRLLQLAGPVETAYAPPAQQVQCAHLLQQHRIEFMLVACWPYLIDKRVVNSVTKGALNLHPSLLPSYPGADPIDEQLKRVGVKFGVTLHLLNSHFDQGDIVAQAELPDQQRHYQRISLERACAQLGSGLFIDALNEYDAGWQAIPQIQQAGSPGSADEPWSAG
jgi:methionyl-tRNA formyltransferase